MKRLLYIHSDTRRSRFKETVFEDKAVKPLLSYSGEKR